MSEIARILTFPAKGRRTDLRPEDARGAALDYLATPESQRTEELKRSILSNTETLFALVAHLRNTFDSSPASVARDAEDVYHWIAARQLEVGLFDEKDYLLGEFALVAGTATRHLGHHERAERWLDLSEAAFRHTINAAPHLTNVAYARLALHFHARHFQEVLDLLPSLIKSYERLGMPTELAKCRFLEAMCLKQRSRDSEAFNKFCLLAQSLDHANEPALLGHVLIEVGGYLAVQGQGERAIETMGRAASLLQEANRPMALAHLEITIGETLRSQSRHLEALAAFRSATRLYGQLEMVTFAAYARLFVAETLIALARPREAEWEILAALPTIENERMVPEGFAAIALLRESVRRRRADPDALRELLEHVRAKA